MIASGNMQPKLKRTTKLDRGIIMSVVIYENQKTAACDMFKHYKHVGDKNSPPILLIAQPQAGKTSTVIAGLDKIIENSEVTNGAHTSRVFWIGPSDRELKTQTELRIQEQSSRVDNSLLGKQTYHTPDTNATRDKNKLFVKNYNMAKSKNEKIFVVIDEAHVGIGKNQNIPAFFSQTFGFFPGIDDHTDGVFPIVVSATPGPHLNFSGNGYKKDGVRKFKYVYLEPGDGYTSLKKLRDSGRINETFRILDDESKDKFKLTVLDPFLDGKTGYLIVRNYESNDILSKYLIDNSVLYNYDIEFFDSKKKNIAKMSKHLCSVPNKHKICVITDSFLQGKTFESLDNVRGWFDRSADSMNETFTIQSVGRNCGYGREHLNYKIWTNIAHVNSAIEFYDHASALDNDWLEENILGSTHLKKKTSQQTIFEPKMFKSKQEMRDYMNCNNIITTTNLIMSSNNTNDMAEALLNKTSRQMHYGEKCYTIYVDGPSKNKKYAKSFEELSLKTPEYIGKYILMLESGSSTLTSTVDTSVFSEK